jgi:hypothetical protein
VLTGWFPLVNSEGIPLEVVLMTFEREGIVPDWISFIKEALDKGWNPGSLRSKIESAVSDVHGPEHTKQVLLRFDEFMKNTQV